ncbi:MAG: tRNA 2-thiouridine(34) synthase MnmA [Clostridia bacterium]|nr:tRNA 2-thiouridine(34) synthase MnmA [Clostridia bacterium]
MSGGVDSSVAALLLMQNGFQTDGATMRLFSAQDIYTENARAFGASDDASDAKAICDRLGIAHYVFDFSSDFRRHVIDEFAASYMRGETPNPCLFCNKHLKFDRFLQEANTLDYDKIATGHYARIEYDSGSDRYLLKKAIDHSKDQTYVLYAMTQRELSHTLLPLGGLLKSEIRDIAEQHGFVNADKPDSQDICFVPDGDYTAFLENILGLHAPLGDFVRLDNNAVVGRHKGLFHYTIGQRKGLGIAAEKPLYVVQKDKRHNRVILGDNADLFSESLYARDCNWIPFDRLNEPIRVTAKTRYKQAETPATVYAHDEDTVFVKFDTPQRAITAGQAVVFYDGDTVVGGGTITSED